jgi:glycosyltransferase involved in cell wall biosynthesis
MSVPAVSVVMAAYNGAALIGETIASLQAQTLADFEVVIVDDCSTDETRDVVRAIDDPRIRLIESEVNQGPVRARNRAVAEARGRYLAGLDQDDLCRPTRLARQVAYLDANPDTVVLGTAAALLENGAIVAARLPPVTTPAMVEWLLWVMNPLVWSSVMIRAEAARGLDPFTRPDQLYAEDFDLYHRLSKVGRVARLDDELLVYRSHTGGASQRFTDTMAASATQVLAGRYAEVFEDGEPRAAAVVRHVMLRKPVPDRATLAMLGQTLAMLQQHFLANRAVDDESRTLIRWETARLWGRIHQVALKSGTITLGDALAERPDHMGLGHAGIDGLLVARALGRARQVKRRVTRKKVVG